MGILSKGQLISVHCSTGALHVASLIVLLSLFTPIGVQITLMLVNGIDKGPGRSKEEWGPSDSENMTNLVFCVICAFC